jgi:uncharacterized membrane protein YeaQ/YmgE (transglycosylase-associated protein family)
MTFLTWIFAGTAAGLLGGLIVSGFKQRKFGWEVLIGLVGAFAGGSFLASVFDIQVTIQPSFSLAILLIGFAGAFLLLAVFFVLRMVRARAV